MLQAGQGEGVSDIFISYSRSKDADARRISEALQDLGYSVWRDVDLPAHRPYGEVTEEALRAAKAVVVIWSAEAVKSQWVRAEADVARVAATLVQLTADGSLPPIPFNQIQCADLRGWAGDSSHGGWRTVLASVAELVAAPSVPVSSRTPAARLGHRRHGPPGDGGAAFTAAALAAVILLAFATDGGGLRGGACRAVGLAFCAPRTEAADSAAVVVQARRQLIGAVTGAWDRQNGSCAKPITIRASTGAGGIDQLQVTASDGFMSAGQVIAADSGAVVTRQVGATQPGAREQWEYRPNGEEMTVLDKEGVATTLIRCDKRSG